MGRGFTVGKGMEEMGRNREREGERTFGVK